VGGSGKKIPRLLKGRASPSGNRALVAKDLQSGSSKGTSEITEEML